MKAQLSPRNQHGSPDKEKPVANKTLTRNKSADMKEPKLKATDPIEAAQKERLALGGRLDKAVIREAEAKKKQIYVPKALKLVPVGPTLVDCTKLPPIVRSQTEREDMETFAQYIKNRKSQNEKELQEAEELAKQEEEEALEKARQEEQSKRDIQQKLREDFLRRIKER